MKYTILASSLLVLSIFSGCSDDTDSKSAQETATASSAPIIEVVQNNNSQAIKVQEKKRTDLELKNGKAFYYDYNIKSAYDQNAQPANSDAGVRVKPRTAIDANIHIRSPYQKIKVSMLVRKMSKKFIVKCSACHNDYANGIIGPSLLGKDADEIFNNIADFKSGKKSNPLMNDLIKMMTEDEIRAIAQEIYEFNLELQKMENK